MNVNLVFANNLRKLCSLHPSIAQVARDNDISKVQMGRYLNGSSIPKPAVLQRFCTYFDVDGRILLEPLDEQALTNLADRPRGTENLKVPTTPAQDGLAQGLAYATQGMHRMNETEALEDGMYVLWRRTHFFAEQFCCLPLIVKTIGLTRVFRGYEDKRLMPNSTAFRTALDREWRGIVHGSASGVSMICFGTQVHEMCSVGFHPIHDVNALSRYKMYKCWPGFISYMRAPETENWSSSPTVMQKVSSDFPTLLKLARRKTLYAFEELPTVVQAMFPDNMSLGNNNGS